MAAKKSKNNVSKSGAKAANNTRSVSKAGVSKTGASRAGVGKSSANIGGAVRLSDPISLEITGVIIIAVSIFLILGIYTEDKAGKLGAMFKSGFVGLFGFGAYILPLIIIGICLYILFSKNKNIPAKKFVAIGCLFITIVIFSHVFLINKNLSFNNLGEYLKYYFVNGGSDNGGVLGAVFGNFLINIFSAVGTYIIIFSSVLVCFITLTGKSFFKGLTNLVFSINEFFSAKDYEEYEVYFYDEEEIVPVKPKPAKRPEQKEPLPKPEIKPSSIPINISTGSESKSPSSYTFEIAKSSTPERKIKLINEEFSKNRAKRDPIINLSRAAYEDALRQKQEEKEKRVFNEDLNKPSVKLKISGIKPDGFEENYETTNITESISKLDSSDMVENIYDSKSPDMIESMYDDLKSSDIVESMYVKSLDTTENIFNEETPYINEAEHITKTEINTKDRNVFEPKPDAKSDIKNDSNYGGDILFNNAPAYEDVTDEYDDIPLDKKDIKPKSTSKKEYEFPPIDLLNQNPSDNTTIASKAVILENSKKLEDALKSFKVEAKVMEVNVGPTVTRYELAPGVGVKVSSISNLADDLALNLAAAGVRIEAPIPGKAAVGIEVPNKEAQSVYLREVVSDNKFKTYPSKLAFALGKDIAGNVVIADIAKMPHMLIAGSTGSGKSVCINTLVTSIIYKSKPEDVKLLMIDPKVVELKVYNGIPHLLIPVVTDPKKAAGALNWAVREMTTRYGLFAETSVRDLKGYNQLRQEAGEETVPQIVIIIDELADLMMTAGKEVEEYICRLAQMARAAGIHLIIATQRPSVDVITGLIKANIPSKIAFAVSSAIDSRTILGEGGAEKLLGRGDMLFYPAGMSKPLRVQGSFVSDKEVESIVSFVKQDAQVEYDEKIIENITSGTDKSGGDDLGGDDEFMEPAIEFIVKKEKASASMLQRQFRIGYNRASRIIEILEERGIVSPEDGSKPRKVLMTKYEWEDYQNRQTARD